ncbi:MAG: hypothetical protein MI739_13090 [Bacteroidales bacterium]|nr:hypothetical protein [Bacteroidales bacterium]
MNCNKKISILLIALLIGSVSYAQRCNNFHRRGDCKIYRVDGFEPYGQARSALIEVKKPTTFKAVFYGQRDYKIVLCTQYGYYPIHYVISNADTKEILYDNQEDDYVESVGFTIDKTQNLIIEITLMAEKAKVKDAFDLRVCAGVNIYWRKVPRMGF